MKTTAVVESLSYYKTNVLFQRISDYFKIKVYAFVFFHTILTVAQNTQMTFI